MAKQDSNKGGSKSAPMAEIFNWVMGLKDPAQKALYFPLSDKTKLAAAKEAFAKATAGTDEKGGKKRADRTPRHYVTIVLFSNGSYHVVGRGLAGAGLAESEKTENEQIGQAIIMERQMEDSSVSGVVHSILETETDALQTFMKGLLGEAPEVPSEENGETESAETESAETEQPAAE